ncbi:MAG TPA: outer membrane beta-barrel protein [Bradyrhizobium sp.]|nr:outer membrane beta-barrel protein [Bradyrhizobium sp.]
MVRFAWIGAGLLSIVGIVDAAAADLPARMYAKAPPPVAAFSWTGCYIGGHVGGAFADDRINTAFGTSSTFGSSGVVGGGQIGCDYQFAPTWVVGFEGRAAGSGLKSSNPATATNLVTGATVPAQFTVRNDFLASATARLGYSGAENWLFYARGGAAWTNEKIDEAFAPPLIGPVDPSATTTRTGWTVGAGAEWVFAPHWSTTLEYNYYDFGSHGVTLTDPRGVTVSGLTLKDAINTVTIGVNYRF